MRLIRVLWLAVIAMGLVALMAVTSAVADGAQQTLPDLNDSTDSIDGYITPDTTRVDEQTEGGTVTTIFWELWGLLF